MFGTLSEETEVKVPASKAWAVYGTLELGKHLTGKIVEAIDVIEGDGGTGTVLKLGLKPDHSVNCLSLKKPVYWEFEWVPVSHQCEVAFG
ncbi:S-norcoclaurine synthase 2-like protein [Tanacetum coccineum]